VAENESLSSKFMDYLRERVAPEVGQMLDHKIAQGAAELGQAMNSSADGYVPYGAGQAPLEVEGPAVSFTETLRDASRDTGQDQDRGMDR
jgi:hypothetical protein